MDAWSGEPIPAQYLKGRTPLERQGRAGFSSQAVPQLPRARRSVDSAGRHWIGWPLRLTQDQLIRQVIQGGGNMPAYGKNLNPAETTALVAFLETLYPARTWRRRDDAISRLPHHGLGSEKSPVRAPYVGCRSNGSPSGGLRRSW